MITKHFTQGLAYQKAMRTTNVVALNFEGIEAIGYVKHLPLSIKILYIPHSPIITPQNAAAIKGWLELAKEAAKLHHCTLVRFDPKLIGIDASVLSGAKLSGKSAAHSFFIQPRFEWQAATKATEVLLATFKQNTRRDYNLAVRQDLTINFYNEFDQKAFDDFYFLVTNTATAQNFNPQTKEYLHAIVQSTFKLNSGFLAIVYHDNIPVTGALIIAEDHTAFYAYGGLNYTHNINGAAIFMHTLTINHCHNLGFSQYNFGAIDHLGLFPAYEGITYFKQRFPGETIDHGPLYDLIIKPVWYYIYTLIRWQRDLLKKLSK